MYLFSLPHQRKALIARPGPSLRARLLEGLSVRFRTRVGKAIQVQRPSNVGGRGARNRLAQRPGDFHWTRTLLFDRAGAKLYVGIGSGSNANVGEDERRATVSRCNPDGSGFEIFAAGLRNPVGLRWYPGTDTLWTSVQERDNLGDDLVPDYLTHVLPKGFYGWPYAYIGPHADPWNSGAKLLEHLLLLPGGLSQTPEISKLVESTITPDVLLGSHGAPRHPVLHTASSSRLNTGAARLWRSMAR